ITINFKADEEHFMNLRVNREIHDAEDIHIIGIDRGERNLLYISVIDMDGRIVEQMSLNEILSYDKNMNLHKRDYHQLLTSREKDNINARQNWTTVNTIKELKEGYLSQVIHVITDLMIKYNAIVVLEDLNFGFKRGRQKFERQVYQKFEKMLIDKLNLYIDKHRDPEENGGLLKAYQLTGKFNSFQTLGKQSGFLFYVPAWSTSKTDPTTGFVNLFYTRYESIEKAKAFIQNMDRIWYDPETGTYAFSFDYSRFTYKAEGSRVKWTVYSFGRRIEHFRNPDNNNEWDTDYIDLTEAFSTLLSAFGVSKENDDLRGSMLCVREADFFKRFMKLMTLMLQMRNSDEKKGIDEIVSPVKNSSGGFFVTGADSSLPVDADANGAYNIAKKGLWIVRKIKETKKEEIKGVKLAMSNKEWLGFAQENTI
ncbi:MAG: type V CRISPR-associated protein Cas12a/Cpf1, partial [Eubacteriales bacterium]|nr:type V CRISPR-associated protein Cas12a/Cpf1 [Eubacteriales bacterium]